MELSDLFIEVVRSSEVLPAEVRAHAGEARAVEQSQFDESYIEFLDTQIRLSPRGPDWTARLRQRRKAMRPHCGVALLSGIVPVGDRHFSVYVLPEQRTIAHWEEYEFTYPTMG